MTIMTKWFGTKVKGEALENLIVALGENPASFLKASERWSSRDAYGKVRVVPVKEGFDVDLYIFREDYHIKDGTIPSDNKIFPIESLLSFSEISNNETIDRYEENLQGRINYENVTKTRINQ